MKENYFSLDARTKDSDLHQRSRQLYNQVNSYVVEKNEQQTAPIYAQLPEEYAVFSEIDNTLFTLNDTDQHRLLSLCLQHLRAQLFSIYTRFNVVRILPKLSTTFDEDGAIILNWAYTSFRVYFNFEVLANSSYYGIVAQSNEDSIFTKSGKLNDTNYASVIDTILQYVIENS